MRLVLDCEDADLSRRRVRLSEEQIALITQRTLMEMIKPYSGFKYVGDTLYLTLMENKDGRIFHRPTKPATELDKAICKVLDALEGGNYGLRKSTDNEGRLWPYY